MIMMMITQDLFIYAEIQTLRKQHDHDDDYARSLHLRK